MSKCTTPKVHLILRGCAICNSIRRDGGRQAVRTVAEFTALPPSVLRCEKCEAALARIRAIKIN